MNVRFLIDRLVQQQAQLLAEVATSGGVRAPLAELWDQLFIHLADELDRRGVSRKVSADMFGMALRAYQKKIQRLAMSSTDNGTSLWQAVLDYLEKNRSVTRAEILQRFCRDDEGQLRAVLHDLTENGLAIATGTGPQTRFELVEISAERLSSTKHFADLLWLSIYREGPIAKTVLAGRNQRRKDQFEQTLELLVDGGRVTQRERDGETYYESSQFEVGAGKDGGWEAAILDHYEALVRTILGVLPGLTGKGASSPEVGGYTYSLDVWPGHPLEDEVLGTLAEFRSKLSDLRKRVDAHNESVGRPVEFRVVRVYGGQSVTTRNKAEKNDSPFGGLTGRLMKHPPDSTARSSRLAALMLLFVAVVVASSLVGGCGSPQNSSESHFGVTRAYLRVCEDGVCESGDTCACAVCTVPCAEPADCAERILGPGADPSELPDNVVCLQPLCVEPSEADGPSGGGDNVCEVTCNDDSDCVFLDEETDGSPKHDGRSHVCRSGACRTDETPEQPSEPSIPPVFCRTGQELVPGAVGPDGIALCLDVTEVTVERFTECVDSGDCDAPSSGNYLTAGRENHPVNFVEQAQAEAYCAFVDSRLPTRAEWQAAARGEGSNYPWGDNAPTDMDSPQLVCALTESDTCPVSSFSEGASAYGHDDLIGNVAELVLDGGMVCAAGGAFDSADSDLAPESCVAAVSAVGSVGFRCVRDL